MSPAANHNLNHLFELFDVIGLGEGDLAAGANTLAAMALSIASCQRPGSAIVDSAGTRTAIGGGFVVSGSLSPSLVAERVIAPLAGCQQGFSEQVRSWLENERIAQASVTKPGQKASDNKASVQSTIGRRLRQVEIDTSYVADPVPGSLTVRPLDSAVRELREHPLVFSTAGTPQGVLRLLETAHLGRPLIHVALSGVGDCQRYSRVCNRVLDGSVMHDPLPVPLRGEVLVTDSGGFLNAAIRSGGADTEWLCRQLWLTDHGADLALEPPGDRPAMAKLDRITARYEAALRQAWDARLNHRTTAPTDLEFDFRRAQAVWVRHLASCESSFPGITAALRPLAASLTYGLHEIYHVFPVPKEASFYLPWVLTFATKLAQRMVNARALMVHDEHRERIMRLAHSIRRKLEDGPQTARELARRSHRLSIPDCEEVLDFLKAGGVAERVANRWSLTGHHSLAPSTLALTINV